MTERTAKRLAWGLFLGGLASVLASIVIDLADARPGQWAAGMLTQPVAFLAIGLAGLAIARRQPWNAIGGTLEIRSEPSRGTEVVGRVPAAPRA